MRKYMKGAFDHSVTRIGVVGGVVIVAGLAIAGADYPEIGDDITGPERDKYNAYLACAISELPTPYKEKLAGCFKPDEDPDDGEDTEVDNVDQVGVTELATGTIPNWRDGSPEKAPKVPAFTPHDPPGDVEKCKGLCIAVSEDMRMWACNGLQSGHSYMQGNFDFVKNIITHETIHWLQYETWTTWQMTNEELYNLPYTGGDWVGRNGNPFFDEDDEEYEEHDADTQTRNLMNKFDEARTIYTETEAELAGNTLLGCDPDSCAYFVEGKEKWLPPEKDYLDYQICALIDCLTELAMDAQEAKDAPDNGGVNDKLRALGAKIEMDLKAMSADAEALKKAKELAEAKWETL